MLFNHLRRYLDTQTITHLSGGIFLHNMKTLMAKIKASDWGSLDQNLATHRAQQLDRGLHIALSRGSTDQGDLQTPLKVKCFVRIGVPLLIVGSFRTWIRMKMFRSKDLMSSFLFQTSQAPLCKAMRKKWRKS
ncbi:hypothetical protein RSOL_318740 [Rhizoctonia solani AG-3 Rhs1AP]|uniref:Uncharacterized protein n=1 Tax=Rhizoctonia solani AG-3 Rhs1AP TaxID=1086054 RepID=A0A0A1UL34_9AGAM|nr:hypothetical protein RSOL_318740 [Rhizoctonia solani AG-3 Rhs1AP]